MLAKYTAVPCSKPHADRVEHRFESLFKSMTQKGNAHLGLGQFTEAKKSYESMRELVGNSVADQYLEKLREAQERYRYSFSHTI